VYLSLIILAVKRGLEIRERWKVMATAMMAVNFKEDVEYLISLPYYKMGAELETNNAKYTRALAGHLGLATRYGDGAIKNCATLVAAIYEDLRRKREER
jgi:hypothetical protein